MYLVSLETSETSYLLNVNKYHKGEDTHRHISVEIHLLKIFYKYIVCFQTFDRFSKHLEKAFHVQIFLPTWLVKISFLPKYFQRHRQTCSISSLSSIV